MTGTAEPTKPENEPTPFNDPKDIIISHTYKQMAASFRDLTNKLSDLTDKIKGKRSIWSRLWETFIVTHHIPKEKFKNKGDVIQSIYPKKDMTVGKYSKKFRRVHYLFKYKMFVPWLIICDKILGKYVDDKIEPEWYNKNMIIWDESWRKTMQLMGKYYNPSFANPRKGSFISYNTIRRLWNTLVLNDTATREFQSVFMHELTSAMVKRYKGHKEVYHVFYTGRTSYDPIYFTIAQACIDQNKHPQQVMQQAQVDLQKRAQQVLKTDTKNRGTTGYQIYKMCEACKQLNHLDTQACSKCGKIMLGETKPTKEGDQKSNTSTASTAEATKCKKLKVSKPKKANTIAASAAVKSA